MTKFTEQKDEAMRIAMQYWAIELRQVVENLSEDKKKEYLREFAKRSVNHKATIFIAFPELYMEDLKEVCAITGAKVEDFMAPNRKKVNVGARMIMSYIWHHEHKLGPVHISRILGMDHATIMYYLKKIEDVWIGDFGFHRECIDLFSRRGLQRCLKKSSQVETFQNKRKFR